MDDVDEMADLLALAAIQGGRADDASEDSSEEAPGASAELAAPATTPHKPTDDGTDQDEEEEIEGHARAPAGDEDDDFAVAGPQVR